VTVEHSAIHGTRENISEALTVKATISPFSTKYSPLACDLSAYQPGFTANPNNIPLSAFNLDSQYVIYQHYMNDNRQWTLPIGHCARVLTAL
jgi:hypothetical protein